MQRTLITGANGFVGQALCKTLQQAGHHVIALSSKASGSASSANEHLQCDIRDTEALAFRVAQAAPTHVVHLAAITYVPASFENPLPTWQTNVMGSVNLLEAVRRHAPKAFMLFVSSSEVYGATFKQGSTLDENSPCQPLNPYAASKLAAEVAFAEYFRQGMPGVIARPFNHIGAQQSPDFVTSSFAKQIALIEAGKQPPQIHVGNLEASRDFLDVRDVCNAYRRLLELAERPRDYPSRVNIASGRPRKIQEILDELLGMSQCHIEVIKDPARMRPSDIPFAAGNIQLLQQLTDWSPTVDLHETLADLLDHWRTLVAHSQ
ncbi:GDP-mannose 4,6-dehydratase [Azomonas macrocytogenes]|nr:GDP-mannose 4,6-dehydratase [Azomonas macrocytogenes]